MLSAKYYLQDQSLNQILEFGKEENGLYMLDTTTPFQFVSTISRNMSKAVSQQIDTFV